MFHSFAKKKKLSTLNNNPPNPTTQSMVSSNLLSTVSMNFPFYTFHIGRIMHLSFASCLFHSTYVFKNTHLVACLQKTLQSIEIKRFPCSFGSIRKIWKQPLLVHCRHVHNALYVFPVTSPIF